MITLLYIVNDLRIKGGVERILCDVINYLSSTNKYNIYILTLSQDCKSAYKYDRNVKIFPLKYKRNNIKYIGQIVNLFRIIPSLRSFINSINPDIVIKVQTNGFSWIIPFVRMDIPKILWIHTSKRGLKISLGAYQSRLFNLLYWSLCRIFFNMYSKTICLTDSDCIDWGVTNSIVIPNFTNFEGKIQKEKVLKKRIICVARYDYYKRIDLLIEIWARLSKEFPEWRFEVYGGEGQEKENLQKLIIRKDITDSFFLYDACSDIDKKYKESDIFCFASEFEGLPLVIIEAMYFGLPVIAFDAPGVSTILQNEYNGYLIPYGDIDGYVKKLRILIESQELRLKYGNNGHEISLTYSKEKIVAKWDHLFRSLEGVE